MNSADATRGARTSFAPALFLLFVAVTINYVDRGNLSIAAPLLKSDWNLSASALGALFSAFFWSYTAMQFVSGWVVDRFDPSRLLALGFLVWTLSTAFAGLSTGFAMLMSLRLLLGIGESVILPTSSKILARYLPEEKRGFANGVLGSAMRCGAVAGSFGGGLLMARYGWRPAFLGIGLLSLLWLPAWWRWQPRGEQTAAAEVKPQTPGFAEIFARRSFWGTSAGHFCVNYLLYFMVTWLPFYLVREWHMTMAGMSRIAALYYLTDATSAFVTGWLADQWMRNGGTTTMVRKTAMGVGCALAAVSLGCLSVATPGTYLSCLLATAVGEGMASAGLFAFGQTLAGTDGVGRWTGLQNGFANFAGVICPALTGFLVDKTGNFGVALGIAAAMLVAGGCAWIFLVGRVEQIRWRSSDALPLTDVSEAV
ncbi:MAG TPA: MFS transporter [Acidobacteriaceae bacterium]|jgi:MFS family permease